MKRERKIITLEEKTFFERHAKKILLGFGVATGFGAYHMLKKHGIELSRVKVCLGETIKEKDKLKDEVDILMAAASEGLFEEALATTTRKLNSRKDRLQFLLNRGDIGVKIDKLQNEINTLQLRRDAFLRAQALVEIKDLDAK